MKLATEFRRSISDEFGTNMMPPRSAVISKSVYLVTFKVYLSLIFGRNNVHVTIVPTHIHTAMLDVQVDVRAGTHQRHYLSAVA